MVESHIDIKAVYLVHVFSYFNVEWKRWTAAGNRVSSAAAVIKHEIVKQLRFDICTTCHRGNIAIQAHGLVVIAKEIYYKTPKPKQKLSLITCILIIHEQEDHRTAAIGKNG